MNKFTKNSGLAVSAIALLAFAGAPAKADDMMDNMDMGTFQVGIGGFFTQGFVFTDTDADNTGDTDFVQNAEIHFKGKGKLDNGVEIGFQVELEAASDDDSDDTIDEHYTYIKGDFGKVIIGAENGVAHLGEATAPTFVAGLPSHNNSLTDDIIEDAAGLVFPGVGDADSNVVRDAHTSTKLENISGDAYKISYFTPRVAGLQAGVSYAPNNNDINGSNSTFGSLTGNQENIYEFNLNYKGEMAGVGVKAAAGYVDGSTEGDGDDPQSWNVGGSLTYAGFTLGGNYSVYENLGAVGGEYSGRNTSSPGLGLAASALGAQPVDAMGDPMVGMRTDQAYAYGDATSEEISTWNIGVAYDLGNTVIGFSYTDSEEDLTATRTATPTENTVDAMGMITATGTPGTDTSSSVSVSGTDYTEWMVGGTTSIAKGVDVGYFYQSSEADYGSSSSDVSLVGLTLALQF